MNELARKYLLDHGVKPDAINALERLRASCVECPECHSCKTHGACEEGRDFPNVGDVPHGCMSRAVVRHGKYFGFAGPAVHASDR